ncbi:MAG: TolC family protein [Candidatus Kapabacteria bacterium]|nr:TolC family protein [Candidatus Kapabacteria bacterium]
MKYIVSLLLISFSMICSAQVKGNKPQTLSLDDCFKIASQKNPDIKLNQFRTSAANADLKNAYWNYFPSVDFGMNYRRTLSNSSSGGTGGTYKVDTTLSPELRTLLPMIMNNLLKNPYSSVSENNYTMQASANWLLFDGLNRDANYTRSQDNFKAIQKSNEYIEKSVKITILRQYIDVVKNLQIIQARKDNLELANKQLERINAQHNAGIITIADVYSQEAEVGNNELMMVQAENDLNIAKANLLTTLGMNSDQPVDFLSTSIPTSVNSNEIKQFRDLIGDLESSLKNAFGSRSDYSSNDFAIKAAESGIKSAKSTFYPRLSANGTWYWANSKFSDFQNNGNTYFGLQLSIPIFSNFNTNLQFENASLQYNQKLIEKTQLEQTIRNSIQTSYLNLEAAEKQIEISNRVLKSSNLNYDAMKEKFNIGAASITELHIAANQLVTSKINNIKAIYNYVQAQNELLFASGRL